MLVLPAAMTEAGVRSPVSTPITAVNLWNMDIAFIEGLLFGLMLAGIR